MIILVDIAVAQVEMGTFRGFSSYLKYGYLQKPEGFGVPVVAQWLTNPTRNHEVAGSIPGLAQWVKDPVLQ